MPPPSRLQPFLNDDPQRLVERVVHRDRRRMMVQPVRPPVLFDQRNVEVPRAALRFALANRLHRALAERHRRQPGRRADSLLRAAVTRVDSPLVNLDRHARERRHRVDRDHRAVPMRQLGDFLDRLMYPRRRLGMNDRDQLRIFRRLQRRRDLRRLDDRSPFRLDLVNLRAEPRRNFRHPRAERAVDADHDLVAVFDQIRHHGFHPRRTGAGDGKRDLVAGAEHDAQQPLDIFHHLQEIRIEMPDDRRRHRFHHARIDVGRPRTEQNPRRRPEFWK